jgi:hypothetical protein
LQRQEHFVDNHPLHSLADPIPDRAIALNLQHFAASQPSHALAGSPSTCAELDRYDIAVVLQAVYEWGGYRYTNASDAIAAAKRGRK